MWDYFVDWVIDNWALALFIGIGGGILILAAAVSAVMRSLRVYLGVGALAIGSGGLLLYYDILYADELSWAGAILFAFGGLSYLFGYLAALVLRRYQRKFPLSAPLRGREYALPERGNEYLRARLNTVLKTDGEELCPTEAPQTVSTTELSYARELLAKVREKEISPTDVLQTEEIGRLLAMYSKKKIIHPSDSRTMNEGFSCLLKLAAKYAVTV